MPTLTVGGSALHYTVHQDGTPVVVLIHGAGGSHLAWPPALRRLPGVTTYALDLPGHGRSTGPGRERVEDYVVDLLSFLDGLGIDRVALVGHSMGGAVAQMTALTAPERAAALVLIGTAARLHVAPAILEGIRHDFEQTVHLISQWAWEPGADPTWVARGEEMMIQTGPQVLLGDFLACDRFDVRNRVTEIASPALVLAGSEDRMTPPRFAQWLAERLPQGEFHLIEGAGHMLALERPHEVQEAVSAFLTHHLG